MRPDRGAASIYAVMAVVVLLLVTGVVVAATEVAHAQHQAAAAADLAALAGASAVADGANACDAADRVASANAAALAACSVSDLVVEVLVEVRSVALWGKTWVVRGTARAGPGGFVGQSLIRAASTRSAPAHRDPAG